MFVVEERPAENAAMAARYQQREQEKTAAAQPAQTNVPVNDSAPPYQPTGANAFDPNAPVVQHKNFVKKIYDRLAINVAFRWILAMVALALSAVILSDGPAKQLKIAAAYTIAVAAIHLPLIGFPKLKPRSPTDASLPKWFLVIIAVTFITWIPSFALMFTRYVKGNNYADDGSDSSDSSGNSGFWKRRIIIIPGGDYGDLANPIDKLALATGIVGVVAFIWSGRLWYHQLALQRGVFQEDDIADVYYTGRKKEQKEQKEQVVQV